jgi:hypothetical protein
MKYQGTIISGASGSVAGCVFSHNRYGPYVRNRSLPVNPNSAYQVAARANFGLLSTAWNIDLDDAERDAWNSYAAGVPRIINGISVFVTGLNWYIALNSMRLNRAIARTDVAPIPLNMTGLSLISNLVADVSAQTLSVGFAVGDEWNADDGYLFIYGARPQNESINFFNGPFRAGGQFIGDTAIPLTSPQVLATYPFIFALGQKLFIRIVASAPDGRISVPQVVSVIATA